MNHSSLSKKYHFPPKKYWKLIENDISNEKEKLSSKYYINKWACTIDDLIYECFVINNIMNETHSPQKNHFFKIHGTRTLYCDNKNANN